MSGNTSGAKWGQHRNFLDAIVRPLLTSPARSSLAVFFLLSILVGAFLSTRFLDSSPVVDIVAQPTISTANAVSSDINPRDNSAQSTEDNAVSGDINPHEKTTQITEGNAVSREINPHDNSAQTTEDNVVSSDTNPNDKTAQTTEDNAVISDSNPNDNTAQTTEDNAVPNDKTAQTEDNAVGSDTRSNEIIAQTTEDNAGITDTQPHEKTPEATKENAVSNDTNPLDKTAQTTEKTHRKLEIPLDCSATNTTQTCPTNYPVELQLDPSAPPPPACPEYFRWIYEDLRPWRETGITRDMVERARRTANFKLVILNGKAYIERYQKAFQTRDVFTLWGFLQLLRKYPGRVPDLELMFDCVDWPVLQLKYFRGPKAPAPPPLFRYCGDDNTYDIVFPDWSFWGWAEINIKPWEYLSKELNEGNKKIKWTEREPYAYWKGNPFVAPTRMDLLKCNPTDKQDWHARVYIQNWAEEAQHGFKQSSLADQCIHQYKIYIEGSAWSVSEKYILACDSVSLIVDPHYYDFFSRSLMPMQHYWPVSEDDKCRSIKYAVEWGESHKEKAQAIGKAASEFILEDLKMDYIYDYMLHLLTEYSKLLKFKPEIPKNAVELCSETMACPASEQERKFMMESMVKGPSDTAPCTMPPPYDLAALETVKRRKRNAVKLVKKWEKEYWDNQTMPN